MWSLTLNFASIFSTEVLKVFPACSAGVFPIFRRFAPLLRPPLNRAGMDHCEQLHKNERNEVVSSRQHMTSRRLFISYCVLARRYKHTHQTFTTFCSFRAFVLALKRGWDVAKIVRSFMKFYSYCVDVSMFVIKPFEWDNE